MKLETERLYIVPCTEESIHFANEQGYNSGPHIVGHVEMENKIRMYYLGARGMSFEKKMTSF